MIQSSLRKGKCSRRVACHVARTSCLVMGFLLYFVAMCRSRSRCWLILLHYLDLIEVVECDRPWMVCLQWSTYEVC